VLKEKRKKQIRLRRNFFPLLLETIFLWGLVFLIVFFIDPYGFAAIPLFLTFFSLSVFLTFSIVFANSRRGLIASFALTIFLLLRYFGIGNILNLLLIMGVGIAVELYVASR